MINKISAGKPDAFSFLGLLFDISCWLFISYLFIFVIRKDVVELTFFAILLIIAILSTYWNTKDMLNRNYVELREEHLILRTFLSVKAVIPWQAIKSGGIQLIEEYPDELHEYIALFVSDPDKYNLNSLEFSSSQCFTKRALDDFSGNQKADIYISEWPKNSLKQFVVNQLKNRKYL